MDLDQLFGEGAELGDDVVVKAQLRFRVHPPKHPVARDIVDRLTSAYDERLDMICEEITTVLQHADIRRAVRSQPLVISLAKAGQMVYSPGAKGGKWYRDGQGHIRYGDKPQGFKQAAGSEHVAPHISHYRPSKFMGMSGIDRDLTGFLMDNGNKYGFSKPELRFLGNWYGTETKSGALFNAFLDCAGLTPDDLKGDISQLRFGAQELTYEEAVFEFFAAQRSLFMGDESDDEDPDGEWETILNDELKPLLDSVFEKYETLKSDEKFKDSFAADGSNQRRRFFYNAKASEAITKDVATHITSGWDPTKQVAEVTAGMRALGLILGPSKVEHNAVVHDRPHLKESVQLDDRLLCDTGNPLLANPEKLSTLTVSQLMLLYAAAELHRRWDPDTRSYSTELQSDVGPGVLGEAAFDAITEKWEGTAGLIRKHLDRLIDQLVVAFNAANHHLDKPKTKKKPKKKAKK